MLEKIMKDMLDRLKDLRIEKQLSQSQIAQLLDLAPTTISSWELYKCMPKHVEIIKMAEIYDVSTDYIYGLSNTREKALLQETVLKYKGKEIKILHAVEETGLSDETILALLRDIAKLRMKD